MKAHLAIETKTTIGEPPMLTLVPTNEHDQRTCERLIDRCQTLGWGRDKDGKVAHVDLPISVVGGEREDG